MSQSDAPDWLIELIANSMRLMSSSPKSVADAVWWGFQQKVALEIKEGLDIQADHARNQILATITADARLVEREQ